jgi:cysteine-rich repeat protein
MRAARFAALALTALMALTAGCYDPTYEGLQCGAGDRCPDDHACLDGMCVENRGECGDGFPAAPEACDDGNRVNETECPYGMATCVSCNADCNGTLPLVGKRCGDGMIDATHEVCDDGNADDCGSCSDDCQAAQVPTAATGMLMNVASLSSANEGQTFTLLDGVRIDRLRFEIDTDGTAQPGIRVNITGGPVAGVVAAINSSPIMIDASDADGGNVRLVNQLLSGRGNQPVETNIPAPFTVVGMLGGAGGDCPAGTGCTAPGVCFSNGCNAGICQ